MRYKFPPKFSIESILCADDFIVAADSNQSNFTKANPLKRGELVTLGQSLIHSIARDQDGRGLHWHVSDSATPKELVAIALTLSATGALYLHCGNKFSYLSINRAANSFDSYLNSRQLHEAGYNFAHLVHALNHFGMDSVFSLLDGVAINSEFIRGFESGTNCYYDEEEDLSPGGEHAKHERRHRANFVQMLRDYAESQAPIVANTGN